MEWIPVEKELPKFNEFVLMHTVYRNKSYVDYGMLMHINANGAIFKVFTRTLEDFQLIGVKDKKQKVTHWQNLPEPPKQ